MSTRFADWAWRLLKRCSSTTVRSISAPLRRWGCTRCASSRSSSFAANCRPPCFRFYRLPDLAIRLLLLALRRLPRIDVLQLFKFLHFMVSLRLFALPAIEAGERKMRLCCKVTLFFDRQQFEPRLLGGGLIRFQQLRFAQRVQHLRHIRTQTIRAYQFLACLMRFALLEQSRPQSVG